VKLTIKTINATDGYRLVEFFDHRDGLFSYEESQEAIEDIPDLGPETFWTTTYCSGLFDSVEAAQRDAATAIPWLRDQS
jgi:hypothetical protein